MFSSKSAALIATAGLLAACATTDNTTPTRGPNLGKPATPQELRAFDISIPPSGEGLPAGGGNAKQGAEVYAAKCQQCHGAKGAGKPADALAGGIGSIATAKPVRTVGSYWPYATTLFDYTRRAMPLQNPKSLTDNEVYAVTAYVLFVNGIVTEDAQMNAQTLPQVKMPNRDGFVDYSRK